jgi:UDP-glucose:(heptosyl)LPS alpha-1,3-glucosyltransferase
MQDQIFSESNFRTCITNSQLMRNELIRRYGLDSERLKVIYPGYDPARFNTNQGDDKRQLMRRKWDVADDHILIGLVTSGAFQLRGVDIAIDAFSKLNNSIRRNARLVVVGNNSQIDDFKKQAIERGLKDKIIFQPAVKEVEYCYHALDI